MVTSPTNRRQRIVLEPSGTRLAARTLDGARFATISKRKGKSGLLDVWETATGTRRGQLEKVWCASLFEDEIVSVRAVGESARPVEIRNLDDDVLAPRAAVVTCPYAGPQVQIPG